MNLNIFGDLGLALTSRQKLTYKLCIILITEIRPAVECKSLLVLLLNFGEKCKLPSQPFLLKINPNPLSRKDNLLLIETQNRNPRKGTTAMGNG